jgi:hypothetical protein
LPKTKKICALWEKTQKAPKKFLHPLPFPGNTPSIHLTQFFPKARLSMAPILFISPVVSPFAM